MNKKNFKDVQTKLISKTLFAFREFTKKSSEAIVYISKT